MTQSAQPLRSEVYAATQRKIVGISLILAPLLLGLATLFWQDGALGLSAGTLQAYSYVFWIPAMIGLFSLMKDDLPRTAAWGSLLTAWVCLAGNNFGVEGVYLESMAIAGLDSSQVQAVADAGGAARVLIFYLPGIFFPLTLLLIGILLLRTGAVPAWCAILLCIGALGFPLSRVPRIELVAHVADLLLLVPLAWLGWRLFTVSDPATLRRTPARST